MYDRAPRDLVKTFGSTPGNVGPGSYDSNVLPRSKIKAGMYLFHLLYQEFINGNNFLKISFAEVKTSVTNCLQFTDGYAPFLSMTSRETFLNVSDQVVAAPGPGHYDPQNAQDGITVST